MQIHLPARVRGRPGRSVVAFWAGALLAVAMLPSPAQAQSFTWNGATSDYGIAGNWSPAAGGPPSLPGQSAVFAGTGSSTITVGIGAAPLPFMFANSWTFTSNSQSYAISGIDLGFNVSGPTGGIINNAGAGKTISIDNRINDGFGGPVGVQQLGNSTLILSGSNSYSGGTLISAGTVQVTNADSVGTGTVTLNGGTFQMQSPTVVSVNFLNNFAVNARGGTVDAAGAEVTLSGTIADGGGAGVLGLTDSVGGGFVQLSGINSYSGGTLVSGTTLFVSNNSSVGTGTVTLDSGTFIGDGASNLTFANNFRINNNTIFNVIDANGRTLTIAGTISDGAAPGMLTVDDASLGNGRVVLLGNNTYSGGTFICFCGTLQLGDATHTASIVGDVTNEGQFIIANANMSTMRSITNDGGLATFLNGTSAASIAITNRNFGETEFVGNATAGNATITNLSGGQTFFLDNSSAGSATITNFSHGGGGIPVGLFFSDNSSAGNATIINNSGGTIDFGFPFGTDTATAGHANITNNAGSQLQFNAFTTAGNAVITTESGGAVAFFDNSTGGNAQFITNGTGYVDFGFSSGPNGDGRITAGSIAGSGFYYIGGGITLAVGGNNLSTVVSGVISDNDPCGCTTGPGSLEKDGSGTLTLSGINAYTGTTVVNGGFLDVEGSIATSSLTTVNAGGALIGAGIVGDTSIANGGIFAPGNGSGTSMTVQGNLAFQSGALYLVQLNSFANVTGTATLAGNVGATLDPSASFVKKQYMILQAAGGVSGTFGAVAAPGGLVGTVSYDPTHAYLNFDLNYGAKNNLNINQQNVANTLSNFFNANGGISAVFAALTPAGLSQASGETGTGIQQATFNAMNMFLNLLTDPFVSGRGGDVTVSGGAQPYAEEDDAMAYAARKSGSARDALAKIPTKAGVARNDLLDNRWSVWARPLAAAPISAATPQSAPTPPMRARSALPPAPIIGFRRRRSQVSRSPAAAPISASPIRAAAGPTCSRPGPSCATAWVRPM